MDLYSADFGAISEGNMRTQSTLNANKAINQHNKDLGGQIAQLKSGQKTSDVLTATKDATGQFWAAGRLPGQVSAYKDWVASQKAPNPTSQGQNEATDNINETEAGGETTTEPAPTLTATDEDGVFESDGLVSEGQMGSAAKFKQGVKSALGVSDEALETAGKGLGAMGAVGTAGLDIYQDFAGGKGFHLAGDNWASKASNVLQIGGAISDLGGAVFPPLALVGGAADILGGVAGEIGDFIDKGKQDDADTKLQQSETEKTDVIQAQAPVQSGRVS